MGRASIPRLAPWARHVGQGSRNAAQLGDAARLNLLGVGREAICVRRERLTAEDASCIGPPEHHPACLGRRERSLRPGADHLTLVLGHGGQDWTVSLFDALAWFHPFHLFARAA
jgi:hypothetical protein